MLTLVYKDIITQKRNLWMLVFYPVFLHIALYSFTDTGAYAAAVAGVVYMFAIGACVQDDQNRSEVLLNSLPISRKSLVLAKYFTALSFLLIGAATSVSVGTVMHFLGFRRGLVTLEALWGMAFAGLFLTVFFLPVYFKYGYIRARIYGLFVFLLIFFMPVAFLEIINGGYLGTGLRDAFMGLNPSDSFMLAITIFFSIILLALSIIISIRSYQKREFY